MQRDYLDQPIAVEKWNELLMVTLNISGGKYESSFLESYTFGLSEGGYIDRGSAVAGMVKLLHVAEMVPGRDATPEEIAIGSKSFYDYSQARDKSKLAIAISEGLVSGYGDGTFRPEGLLTCGEALALVTRIVDSYF